MAINYSEGKGLMPTLMAINTSESERAANGTDVDAICDSMTLVVTASLDHLYSIDSIYNGYVVGYIA